METIRGKHASHIDADTLAELLAGYKHIHIDVGTGDGRFVRHVAQTRPATFAIGVDACRENLHDGSRRAPANALFVIASAQSLPRELHRLASRVTINFPWGSLLEGLLAGDPALLAGLAAITRPGAQLEVRLNGGALAEAGWSPGAGSQRVWETLRATGFDLRAPITLTANDLRGIPTTWARRLAFGRDPRAVCLRGTKIVPVPPHLAVNVSKNRIFGSNSPK